MTKRERDEIYENKFLDFENGFGKIENLFKKIDKQIELKLNKDEIEFLKKEKLDIKDFLKHIPQHLHLENISMQIEEICEVNNEKIVKNLDSFRY